MTEQSQNALFHSFSFLQGHNAAFVEELYARYAEDPSSVDPSWAEFFRSLGDDDDAGRSTRGPSWARTDWPPRPKDELTAALTGEWPATPGAKTVVEKVKAAAAKEGATLSAAQVRQAVTDSVRALMLIRAYRHRGHLVADLDPLGVIEPEPHPELDPKNYGFTEADMDRPIFLDNVLGLESASLREILQIVKRTYCGTFALQFM